MLEESTTSPSSATECLLCAAQPLGVRKARLEVRTWLGELTRASCSSGLSSFLAVGEPDPLGQTSCVCFRLASPEPQPSLNKH